MAREDFEREEKSIELQNEDFRLFLAISGYELQTQKEISSQSKHILIICPN